MPEYREKTGDEKMEAFNDRTKRIDYPYVLEYESEAKIYEKMLNNADVPNVHVEPHALEMAGLFGVLTRLEEPADETVSLLDKAKVYNGELEDEEIDRRKLREDAAESADVGEGMDGISARFVGDEIAEAIMDATHRDRSYLSPLSVFDHFEANLGGHGSIAEADLDRYERLLETVREEYRERAIEDVRHALAYDVDELRRQGEKYMDHVMAYIDDATVDDELTGRETEPDETFLRAVEEQLDVPSDRKDDFRQEVSNWVSRRAREGARLRPAGERPTPARARTQAVGGQEAQHQLLGAGLRDRPRRRGAERVGRRLGRPRLLRGRRRGGAGVRGRGRRPLRRSKTAGTEMTERDTPDGDAFVRDADETLRGRTTRR